MAFKFEIADPKAKRTYHFEAESETIMGKTIGEKVNGEDISPQLAGAEFEITGTSDKAGFPGFKSIEGPNLKRVLLTKGKGMHEKKRGLRLRKTVRGNVISSDIAQINLKLTKPGAKSLAEMLGKEAKSEDKTEEKKEEKSD